MRERALGLTGLLLFLLVSVGAISRADDEKYSVATIHAYLYYQSTGAISQTDLLDGKVHELRNIPIGKGEAATPSRAIFVLVDLVVPNPVNIEGKLTLKAKEGGIILFDQTMPLDTWFTAGGRLVLPFIVYRTGSQHLEITATLHDLPVGRVSRATLKRTIPFEIGE